VPGPSGPETCTRWFKRTRRPPDLLKRGGTVCPHGNGRRPCLRHGSVVTLLAYSNRIFAESHGITTSPEIASGPQEVRRALLVRHPNLVGQGKSDLPRDISTRNAASYIYRMSDRETGEGPAPPRLTQQVAELYQVVC
jgi:hypothetical protein